MKIIENDLKKWPKDSFSDGEIHYPVMCREVIEYLALADKKVVVDCTVGVGSHALSLIPRMAPGGLYVGIDKDNDSLEIAKERLGDFVGRFILIKEDFRAVDSVLEQLQISRVDAFLFDLGISSFQLTQAERGFSFLKEGPLDMRMDRESFLCAYDLVNNLSERELRMIFEKFGEERYSRRIAHHLIEKRRKTPLYTTRQLVEAITESVPYRSFRYKIHPATRVFQALRIAVNRELDCLSQGLDKAFPYLSAQGRMAVISFHSLEDREVKHTFRNYAAQGHAQIITKKPLTPSEEELVENNASRSAKLRVIEKL
ncbi:MAG: 16S rRNA (cytosine(1402)-N(4))-methyltransferase RsmH [Candidatus Omnitrophica bacterium]|nr:16S rRNA (cytosine(1402)-N(4))-methyltransferase RsmH [Candidatus Omnitrophota bacterium]